MTVHPRLMKKKPLSIHLINAIPFSYAASRINYVFSSITPPSSSYETRDEGYDEQYYERYDYQLNNG